MPDGGPPVAITDAFHLPLAGGRRFCVMRSPGSAGEGRNVLYVHPFGEEMNKARRMAALQACALARAGWRVLQIDLYGSGDSDGNFGDATWSRWIDDVLEASGWLRERFGAVDLLWGLRVGCLIAADAARSMSPAPDFLFWQPVTAGRRFLQHLLRLHIAGGLVGGGDARRPGADELRTQFAQGRPIEIAGYEVSADLALRLESAKLLPTVDPVHVAWLEIAATDAAGLAPAAERCADAWRRAGHAVTTRTVRGPSFWQTQEIAECPELVRATLAALDAIRT